MKIYVLSWIRIRIFRSTCWHIRPLCHFDWWWDVIKSVTLGKTVIESAQQSPRNYGRGLGSQCYLTCLHASCNVATFNAWLFNAWYSCFNSNLTLLHSISFSCNLASVHLTFVLRPCRLFIVQCVMPFFVLPLFILRPVIILTSSCHYCFVCANCNYTPIWRFTRTP